jgi:hypothetical protein
MHLLPISAFEIMCMTHSTAQLLFHFAIHRWTRYRQGHTIDCSPIFSALATWPHKRHPGMATQATYSPRTPCSKLATTSRPGHTSDIQPQAHGDTSDISPRYPLFKVGESERQPASMATGAWPHKRHMLNDSLSPYPPWQSLSKFVGGNLLCACNRNPTNQVLLTI